MIAGLARLWAGELTLRQAFWDYAIIYGTLINFATTIGAFAVLAAGLGGWIALAVHLLPLPYNIATTIGVWRSAARYQGPPHWAQNARIAVVIWALAATLL